MITTSTRARSARRLASLLAVRTGVHVVVRYDRPLRRYRVVWTNGPDEARMRTVAMASATVVPDLDLGELLWHRSVS
ncbi:hypothetical protein [Allokutzneria albata]|uniref:Uncharacterized protein n=1 Tax=Allokutzneria albata TaxID=211114 RepID=A0A1G9T787_ALLAB|nr:hypothetical protein [Allokutzneria albata]SDM43534.1 hypothetical protein SAMN04489726_1604 [Allokutzneria albata]